MNITEQQDKVFKRIMNNLNNYPTNQGTVSDIVILENMSIKNQIFIRYKQDYYNGDYVSTDLPLIGIDESGKILKPEFKTANARYAFLGECREIQANDLIVT